MKRAPLAPWHWFTWLYNTYPRQTVAAIALLVAVSAAATGYTNIALGRSNARNAVVNCENANESRAASRNLWEFVINLSVASNPGLTEPERAFIAEFGEYVDKVYRLHDCGDLSKKYDLPPPPAIPAAS